MPVNDCDLGGQEGCLPTKGLGAVKHNKEKICQYFVSIRIRVFVKVSVLRSRQLTHDVIAVILQD